MEAKIHPAIEKIRRRDENAFAEFYDSQIGELGALALYYLKNRHEAEDVLQNVFEAFLRAIFSGQNIAEPRLYLFKALRYQSLFRQRKQAVENKHRENLRVHFQEHTASQANAAERDDEDHLKLWQAVDTLPEDQREIVLLHTKFGLTFEQAASMTQKTLGRVQSNYYAALKEIRRVFGGAS